MHINFSKSFQFSKIADKTLKFCTNPINFKGGEQDSLELQKLTPDAEAQYQEQKAIFDREIKEYQNDIEKLEKNLSIYQEKKNFYETVINPNTPRFQQLTDLIQTLKPFETEEKEYRAKRRELQNIINKKALKDPNWREDAIRVIKKYMPDYQSSKNESKKFLIALIQEITDSLDSDYNDRKKGESAKFEQSCKQILAQYFADNGSWDIRSSLIDCASSTLFETRNIYSLNSEIEKYADIIDDTEYKILDIKQRINKEKERLLRYRKYLISNPQIAPYYKPYGQTNEIRKELIEQGGCIDICDVVDEDMEDVIFDLEAMGLIKIFYNMQNRTPFNKSSGLSSEAQNSVFVLDSPNRESIGLIDMTDEISKQTAQTLISKKGRLTTYKRIKEEFNIPKSYIDSTNIPKIEFQSTNQHRKQTLTLYELNEDGRKALEEQVIRFERTKLTPYDDYYISGFSLPKKRYVPAAVLKKLGFFSIKGLTELVKNGVLEGYIKEVETENGLRTQAYIDLYSKTNISKLPELRKRNRNTLTLGEFAKVAGITQKNLMENIKDGNVDIIKKVIFNMDLDHIFIDLNVEKNRQFLFEKTLENQLKKEQIEQEKREKELERINNKDLREKYASLRMKLVWYFCPKTKQIGSEIASKDGYLCKLLEKESNDEELTQHEKIKINSYRKSLWLTAGVDELKEGYKKADEIIEQVKSSGINSIEDEEIRNILAMYF